MTNILPLVDPYMRAQESRDFHASDLNTGGNFCLRWSTCGRCGWVWHTATATTWLDQDKAEEDHEMYHCSWSPPPPELIDPDIGWWTYPDPSYHWIHRMEPEPETTPREYVGPGEKAA